MNITVSFDHPLEVSYDLQDVNVYVDTMACVMYGKRASIRVLDPYKLKGWKNQLEISLLEGVQPRPMTIEFSASCGVTVSYTDAAGCGQTTSVQTKTITMDPAQGTITVDDQVPASAPAEWGSQPVNHMPEREAGMPVHTAQQPGAPLPLQPQITELLMLKEEQLYRFLEDHRHELQGQVEASFTQIDEMKKRNDQLERALRQRQEELQRREQQLTAAQSSLQAIDAQIQAMVQAEVDRREALQALSSLDREALTGRVLQAKEMIEVRKKAVTVFGTDAGKTLDGVSDILRQASELVEKADTVLADVIRTREEISAAVVAALSTDGLVDADKLKGGV